MLEDGLCNWKNCLLWNIRISCDMSRLSWNKLRGSKFLQTHQGQWWSLCHLVRSIKASPMLTWSTISPLPWMVKRHRVEVSYLFKPFTPADAFWCLCSRRLLKTLWQNMRKLMQGINVAGKDCIDLSCILDFH